MKLEIQKTEKRKITFDYKTIKIFEDACKKLSIDPLKLPDLNGIPEEFHKPIIAGYKLMIVYKAINNGWRPDWSNWSQYKYYPWFRVSSSGFGFANSYYNYDIAIAHVGFRLCTNTSEKALYIGEQFKDLYQDYFLYSE
ncbi:MAG: hypothetical protein NTW82_14070 [Bacteroidia bacterium]|nr:hypothetical protein [Bacteroidia bacterium]